MSAGYDPALVQATYGGSAAKDADTFDPSGKYVIKKQGAFACVECAVSEGDELMSEGGSMVSMSKNIDLNVGGTNQFMCLDRTCGNVAGLLHVMLLIMLLHQ